MSELEFKNYEKSLKELEYISKAVGTPLEYTQGGCKLKQITPIEGYVMIDYEKIKNYYENVDINAGRDFEKESADLAKQSTVPVSWLKPLRPSVEAGFHSVLKKYVIHTHSVYANILTCIKTGRETVEKIFKGKPYETAWVPYINPGFCLTLKIMDAVKECVRRTGKAPEVFFMENHGLIVTSDDCEKSVKLHSEINDTIKEYFGIKDAFPSIELFTVDENTVISKTGYIRDFIKGGHLKPGFFDEVVLYPDQFVYLNGGVAFGRLGNKMNIITDTDEVIYKTGPSEARTMEETLLACVYVVNEIRKRGLELKTMTEKDIDFIRNWESEAYRRSLVKEMAK